MEPRTDLRPAVFRDHVGEPFALPAAGVDLLLESLDDSMGGAGLRDGGAFSLYFRGPVDPALGQGTYHLTHGAVGDLLLFLVPVRRADDGGYVYEAAFN